jgi:hypothetical protein
MGDGVDDNKMADIPAAPEKQPAEESPEAVLARLRAENEQLRQTSAAAEAARVEAENTSVNLRETFAEQLQVQLTDALKQSKHPHDFIAVAEEEKTKADALSTSLAGVIAKVNEFAGLDATMLGMLECKDIIPEKTSEEGLIELEKNIQVKSIEMAKACERIYTRLNKLPLKYQDIQKLKHKHVKYVEKHTKDAKVERRKKRKRQELAESRYDDKSEEEEEEPDYT